jgi:hypothetical protein
VRQIASRASALRETWDRVEEECNLRASPCVLLALSENRGEPVGDRSSQAVPLKRAVVRLWEHGERNSVRGS